MGRTRKCGIGAFDFDVILEDTGLEGHGHRDVYKRQVFTGKAKDVSALTFGIAALFLVKFFLVV